MGLGQEMIIANCETPQRTINGIFACGQCPLCLKQKTKEWSIRAIHEMYTTKPENCQFLTLTYKPKHLVINKKTKPENEYDKRGTLVPKHVTDFIKRLRKKIKKPIKYIYCGEYGGERWRPHYHIVIYGFRKESENPDKHTFTGEGQKWWDKLWGWGHVDVDDKRMHEHAIQYVTGYTRKKITNKYKGYLIYQQNGRVPPYQRQSQGIGKDWAIKNVNIWTRTLKCAYKNNQVSIPRYYINTIFKMEGWVQRIERKILYNTLELEIQGYYKTYKNTKGKYTKRIIRMQDKLRRENFKELLQESKKESQEYKDGLRHYIKDTWLKRKYQIKKWKLEAAALQNIPTGTKLRTLKPKLEIREIGKDEYKEAIKNRYKTRWGSWEPHGAFERQMHQIARQRLLEATRGIYGKRDRYEKLETIYGTEGGG